MVKLTGMPTHTTRTYLGSILQSEADLRDPSVRGTQSSMQRDFLHQHILGARHPMAYDTDDTDNMQLGCISKKVQGIFQNLE